MTKRAQPIWETVAIFLAIVAIWPTLLRTTLHLPAWLTWGLLGAALVLMVVVFVRRVRRLSSLGEDQPDSSRGPRLPPGCGPPA